MYECTFVTQSKCSGTGRSEARNIIISHKRHLKLFSSWRNTMPCLWRSNDYFRCLKWWKRVAKSGFQLINRCKYIFVSGERTSDVLFPGPLQDSCVDSTSLKLFNNAQLNSIIVWLEGAQTLTNKKPFQVPLLLALGLLRKHDIFSDFNM